MKFHGFRLSLACLVFTHLLCYSIFLLYFTLLLSCVQFWKQGLTLKNLRTGSCWRTDSYATEIAQKYKAVEFVK